jgi:hypothetical protein
VKLLSVGTVSWATTTVPPGAASASILNTAHPPPAQERPRFPPPEAP